MAFRLSPASTAPPWAVGPSMPSKSSKLEPMPSSATSTSFRPIPDISGPAVEKTYIDILRAVKISVHIPVAVKLSPFFSNMANMAKRLDEAGANALVLFNRFYQPDINLDELEIQPNVLLSTPQALRLPLTWIGILYGRIRANLAATSGVHGPEDVIKLLMVGADVTMLCSTLLRNGINHLRYVEAWFAGVDGKTRIRIGSADEGQHEPDSLSESFRFRACAVHEGGQGCAACNGHRPRGLENLAENRIRSSATQLRASQQYGDIV